MQQPIQPPQGASPQENVPTTISHTHNKKKNEYNDLLFMEHWLLLNQQEDEDNENSHLLSSVES
jgi:hypothetical protein